MRINIRRPLFEVPVRVTYLKSQDTISLSNFPEFTMDVDYQNDFSFKAKFSAPATTMGGILFGFFNGNDDTSTYRLFGYQGKWYFDICSIKTRGIFGICKADEVYELEVGNTYVKDIKNHLSLYNVGYKNYTFKPSTFMISQFRKLYYVQLFNAGVMVKDLVPVYFNGRFCLWDKLSNEIYNSTMMEPTGEG